MNLRSAWALAKEAASSWVDDYAPSMGAALAYYTMFSIAPLLLIVISVAGLVFGQEAARGEIFEQLRGLMGDSGASAVQSLLESVNQPTTGMLATIFGVVALLIGATTVFGELQDALDRIWRAPARPKSGGIWALVRSRLLSLGMILGIGFLLMVSLIASAAMSALERWWDPLFGGAATVAKVVNFSVSFAFVTVVFALIYKLMPRVRIKWRDVWVGAVVTALLFTVGKTLIGMYIGSSGVASAFGAAASLVALVVWVYWSAQIFLLGAEFTWVYARRHGSLKNAVPVPPAPGAEPAPPVPSRSAREIGGRPHPHEPAHRKA